MPRYCFAAFIVSLVGIGLSLYAWLAHQDTFDSLLDGSWDLTEVGKYIWVPFAWVGVVNFATIAVSCAASNKAKNHFSERTSGCLVACCRCLSGPCPAHFMWILVVLSFLGQLGYSYGMGLLFFVMETLKITCESGDAAVQAASNLTAAYRNNTLAPFIAGRLDFDAYCTEWASKDHEFVPLFMFVGACITVISQAAMMVAITADSKRLITERRAVSKLGKAVSDTNNSKQPDQEVPNPDKNLHRI